MKYAGPEELAFDMAEKANRNSQLLLTYPLKKQGVEMAKIFDTHDLVFATHTHMGIVRSVELSYVKGSYSELQGRKNFDASRVRATAFSVANAAEAQAFAEIYGWRQTEIRTQGKVSPQITAFWECMTPGGRLLTGPGATVRDWNGMKEASDTLGLIMNRVMGIVRSA
ncbi:hypothetical protein [Methylobacterium flocculans]|uniref:hypothetical protein n=1 Tax=Methylobacterium flocculans TaxID=2984843 RepID=UPI0021F3674F|nr:hypothetical protein [Methylobacterium sp. FF17]